MPLCPLLIQLLPQLPHLLRMLQQKINRRAQTNRRRIAPRANIRDGMVLDILDREPVRVHRTQYIASFIRIPLFDLLGNGLGAELRNVSEGASAGWSHQLGEAEDEGVPFGDDADDSAVAGEGVDGGHDTGDVAAGAEEVEGFAELGWTC